MPDQRKEGDLSWEAKDSLGLTLFREDMISTIWPQQRKHLACIQDAPVIHIYTFTGHIYERWHQVAYGQVCARVLFLRVFLVAPGLMYPW